MFGTHTQNSEIYFRLFGGFEVFRNSMTIVGLHKRHGERVLAYLVLHNSRWVEKELIGRLFWGAAHFEDKAQNVRQSLSGIRQLLREHENVLESRTGAVRIVLEPEQADTLTFDAALTQTDSDSLSMALSSAEETLLDGWSDSWITPFREKYAKKILAAHERLSAGALTATTLASPTISLREREFRHNIGGVLALTAHTYIPRAADRELAAAISDNDGVIVIKGPRQMGKSSLVARGLQSVRIKEYTTFHTDFEQLTTEEMANRDALYLHLAVSLSEQSGVTFSLTDDWKSYSSAPVNLERFLRERILKGIEGQIIWALDGVDSLFATNYFGEFFAFLRGIHSKRATHPMVPWTRLALVIVTATEAHLYIRDLNQSPFNVGTRIEVTDFASSERQSAIEQSGMTLASSEEEMLHDLLGGHPYLLMRGLHEIKTRGIRVDTFIELAALHNGPYHDHLDYLRRYIVADSELSTDLKAILDRRTPSDSGFFRLRSAGVVIGDTPEDARPRCGLYRSFFVRCLKSQSMQRGNPDSPGATVPNAC